VIPLIVVGNGVWLYNQFLSIIPRALEVRHHLWCLRN